MAEVGTVQLAYPGPNRDELNPVMLIKAEVSSPEDIQTLQLIGGLDQAPIPGSKVLIFEVGASYKLAIPLSDGTVPIALVGDKYLYAQLPDGTIISSVKVKNTGQVVVNDGFDFGVAYTRLLAAFNTLKAELAVLTTIVNTHWHTESLGGVTTAPVGPPPTYTPATPGLPGVPAPVADMSGAISSMLLIP